MCVKINSYYTGENMSQNTPEKSANLVVSEAKLKEFMATYKTLSEGEKFALAKMFNQETGGKLSPYNSPQPVAVALIPIFNPENGDWWVLGGVRAIAPKIGEVALPGGFFEPLEHGGQAAKREVFEETGLDLDPSKFQSFHQVLTSPTNNSLTFMLYTEGLPLTLEQLEEIKKNAATPGETGEIVLISKNDNLAFPFHEQACEALFNMSGYDLDRTINWADEYVPHSKKVENEEKPETKGFRFK